MTRCVCAGWGWRSQGFVETGVSFEGDGDWAMQARLESRLKVVLGTASWGP